MERMDDSFALLWKRLGIPGTFNATRDVPYMMPGEPHPPLNASTAAWVLNYSTVAFDKKLYDYADARNRADIAKYL